MKGISCFELTWTMVILLVTLTVSVNTLKSNEIAKEEADETNGNKFKRAAIAAAPGHGKSVIAVAGKSADELSDIINYHLHSHHRKSKKGYSKRKHHHRGHHRSSSSSSSSSEGSSYSSDSGDKGKARVIISEVTKIIPPATDTRIPSLSMSPPIKVEQFQGRSSQSLTIDNN